VAAATGSGGAGVKVAGLRCEAARSRCEVAAVRVAGSRCEAVVVDMAVGMGFVTGAKVAVSAVVAGSRCMRL